MKSLIVEQDIENVIKALGSDAMALEGKTLLISGSSGFLGNHFMIVLQRLNQTVFKNPCSVIAIDNYITGSSENILGSIIDKNFISKNLDVCSPLTVNGPVDYIIHLAGIASPVYYMKFPLETIKVATFGTENLLRLAQEKKVKKFVFFSSSEIYGDPTPNCIPTPETYKGNVSSTGPRACYDESKRLGETLCMIYHRLHKVPVQIVRPFNIYGSGMKPDDRRVIPQFLLCALAGKPLPIHGSGAQTRSYCYISDAMTGFFKVLLSKDNGEAYNIGNHQDEINLINLAEIVVKLTKGPTEVVKIPYPDEYPSDEPNRRCPDITKAMKELQYFPRIDLATGLQRTLSWYKETYWPG